MAKKARYYLKQVANKDGERLIILKFKYDTRVLNYTWGLSVKKSDWNPKQQRLRNPQANHLFKKINNTLDDLSSTLSTKFEDDRFAGNIPEPEIYKDFLDRHLKRTVSKTGAVNSFWALIADFKSGSIKDGLTQLDKVKGTLATYGVVESRLRNFEKETKYTISFESISKSFFEKFTQWMYKKQVKGENIYVQNTVHKTIKILKVFLNRAVSDKLTSNIIFREKWFHIPSVEAEDIALSRDEIEKLFKFDLSENKTLEQVRDLFIFGCSTGLRISDFSNVKPENIVTRNGKKHIEMRTEKTKELVSIPCNDDVLKIFKKYSSNPNCLPKSISDQKFNENIKMAAKEAGLTETGRIMSEADEPLYKFISSRTCRKSLCTNLYLENVPIPVIMKISGHKSESSFFKYIRVSQQQAANSLMEHEEQRIKKNKLKAVI